MVGNSESNCAGYTLYRLGLGPDCYRDADDTIRDYFMDAGDSRPEAIAVIINGWVFHIVPFNPDTPD
ncbi:hypothetical protein A2971_00665 [Candidatus Gottesmanbacteria bacterium RIFCSPLOWO2_01_FULL_46_21]|uniref:Uncharacterized protein n=1 Tax=Candidatus Gottesmanbacteria bacterium RIFCSPLOWO2_01_FULL_46_21 TaxID=1798393 RepID=A0A1F6AYK8_9BACT|nr:MAG: hypothetical protein A2971_00665 [Candidatus Gottesmanbacteria bacterium RIFCSPLOWO2_01_FULL_46_21]